MLPPERPPETLRTRTIPIRSRQLTYTNTDGIPLRHLRRGLSVIGFPHLTEDEQLAKLRLVAETAWAI
jgi:hypothetical protein